VTSQQASDILTNLAAAFTKRLTDEERTVWVDALCALDAATAVQVAMDYAKVGERFPTLPEFRHNVRLRREHARPPVADTTPRSKPPAWVHRWVAARFLYARFDRRQDMRRFVEQSDWRSDGDVMPPTEWQTEGAAIEAAEVWAAVQHGPGLPYVDPAV
jgi:hypothetical protein